MAPGFRQLVARARRGEFRDVLPALRAMAEGERGRESDRWQAAATAITIMFWLDEFAAAAQLAEDVVRRDGPRGGTLCDQDVPFDDALVAADVHAGIAAQPRLERLSAVLPAGRVLTERFAWLAREVGTGDMVRFLPNFWNWGEEPKPLDGVIGAEYLAADDGSLPERERRLAWAALRDANQAERGWRRYEQTGQPPPEWPTCIWLAGWCAVRGARPEGERLLIAAHDLWQPYAAWDCLPADIVVQPLLRTLVTARVREHYLDRPVDGGADSGTKEER